MRYAISPDTQFNNSGIGGVTKINYRNDFDFYKRYLIEANANYPKTIQALLRQWDEELFASHNDVKGHTDAENAEVIPIDDDDEMAREMQMLELRSDSPQNEPDGDPDEAELSPVDNQLGDEGEDENMHASDNDPDWMRAPIANPFPEQQADPGPGDLDIDEHAPDPGPHTAPTPAPTPPTPAPAPQIEQPSPQRSLLTARTTRTALSRSATDSGITGPPEGDNLNAVIEPTAKRGRGRGRGRARK